MTNRREEPLRWESLGDERWVAISGSGIIARIERDGTGARPFRWTVSALPPPIDLACTGKVSSVQGGQKSVERVWIALLKYYALMPHPRPIGDPDTNRLRQILLGEQ